MKTSESIVNIAKALAAAQGEIKNPEANETVEVHAKKEAGGHLLYSYKYATLPKCFDAVRAPFAKHGLSHAAFVGYDNGKMKLRVRIIHESGEYYESERDLSAGLASKDSAGEITFWKRYLFNGMAGIAGDEDIRTEDGDAGPPRPERPQGNSRPPQQNNRPANNSRPASQPKTNAPAQQKPAAAPPAAAAPPPAAPPPASEPTPTFDQMEAPAMKRPRGVIVNEIMAVATTLGVGQDLTPPDQMKGLAKIGQDMFQSPLEKLTEDQLEKMLAKLNDDMRGK